jgi:hypothetical protein
MALGQAWLPRLALRLCFRELSLSCPGRWGPRWLAAGNDSLEVPQACLHLGPSPSTLPGSSCPLHGDHQASLHT